MTPKNQRLLLVLLALAAVAGAALLALSGLKDQAAFFYAPGDVKRDGVPLGRAVRLGGMVQAGSIQRQPDGVTIRFTVGDGQATVPVTFRGVPPDLFRERSGVVAEGSFSAGRQLHRDQPARQARRALHAARTRRQHARNPVAEAVTCSHPIRHAELVSASTVPPLRPRDWRDGP